VSFVEGSRRLLMIIGWASMERSILEVRGIAWKEESH
jgi:hypothetical protein